MCYVTRELLTNLVLNKLNIETGTINNIDSVINKHEDIFASICFLIEDELLIQIDDEYIYQETTLKVDDFINYLCELHNI